MKEFIEKLIGRLEDNRRTIVTNDEDLEWNKAVYSCTEIVNQLAEEYNNGWIPCSERLPECENKYGWVSCIVSVIRSHYPTSTYDICDSPYDENIVMHADYNVSQKIWHLDCDEQLNALIDIEDAPLNGDYVIAWQPLPTSYQPKGEGMAEFNITERTEPFTIEEVFDFIDDTNIGKMDSCELKSRIVDAIQAERNKAIDEFAGKLKRECMCKSIGDRLIISSLENFDKIAEKLKGGAE